MAVVTAALGGCGREPAQAAPPAARRGFARRDRFRGDDAEAGDRRRDDGAPDEAAGDRRRQRWQSRARHPGLRRQRRLRRQRVAGQGFDVQTPEFEVRLPFAEEPELTVGGAKIAAKPLELTIGTPPQGVTGPLVAARVEDSPGCTASDYDGLPVAGAVVLVDRGECQFSVKQAAAAERGAVAMIVANNVDGDEMGGTLGEDTDVKIPVVSVTKASGARLRAEPGDTTLRLDAGVRTERTRNVIAQTKTGSTTDVVMVGAHLDSVPDGPGINDNGSGVAAVLETALQLGSSPQVNNAVRFGFWGAEELGLLGSKNYLESLTSTGSGTLRSTSTSTWWARRTPDTSPTTVTSPAHPTPRRVLPRVPEGSAGHRTHAGGLPQRRRKAARGHQISTGGPTTTALPWPASRRAGLFTGAEAEMSDEQAERWGGEAGQPFDPNYHKKTDTLEHIDRTAMEINGGGVAYVVGLYAQDQGGRNGLPIRDDRTRHVLTNS